MLFDARVKQIVNKASSGATTFDLSGAAVSGGFVKVESAINPVTLAAIANELVPYVVWADSLFEEGYGTVDITAHTLTRTQVIRNSSGTTAKIDFSGASAIPVLALTWGSVIAQSAYNAGMYAMPGGRLTFSTGNPVPTADLTGQSTLYLTPYKGDSSPLYLDAAGTLPVRHCFTEISLALSSLTAGVVYDVFEYLDRSAHVNKLETLAWTSSGAGTSARATNLVWWHGSQYKSGDYTRLYRGTMIATAATTGESSLLKRYLYNAYNQEPQYALVSYSTSHGYGTATFRQMAADGANQTNFVLGNPQVITLGVQGIFGGSVGGQVGAAIDTTAGAHVEVLLGVDPNYTTMGNRVPFPAVVGYNYLALNERAANGTSVTFCIFGGACTAFVSLLM